MSKSSGKSWMPSLFVSGYASMDVASLNSATVLSGNASEIGTPVAVPIVDPVGVVFLEVDLEV
jgi:hypothetical protein